MIKVTINFETSHWYKEWSDRIMDLLVSFGICTSITIETK